MDKKFNTIWREGKKLDMYQAIEELQAKYYHDLQASVDSYDTYDGVSDATWNDFMAVKGTLEMFQMLHYLYRDEAEDMIQVAREQRKAILENLERGISNAGN